MNADHTFFQNRDCKYFPCHSGVEEAEFNCLFCYCPLYALGERCGGNFTYSEKGNKNCKNCTRVHEKGGYELVRAMYPALSELAGRRPQSVSGEKQGGSDDPGVAPGDVSDPSDVSRHPYVATEKRQGVTILAFTGRGCELAKRISGLDWDGEECAIFVPKRFEGRYDGVVCSDDLKERAALAFKSRRALIFIGAAGIAVRYIAGYIRSKTEDPAVLCMDEKGEHVIPLLSGHIGGANHLAERIAREIGAGAVITTATDVNGLVAPDVFAKENSLEIADMDRAKECSAAMLEGRKTEYVVSPYTDLSLKEWEFQVFPKCTVLGVGCRCGTDRRALLDLALEKLVELKLSPLSVVAVASLDIKKDEEAIRELAAFFKAESEFFTPDELNEVEGDFSASDFVKDVTGVDNVCERAVMAYSKRVEKDCSLVLKKTCREGMTLAVGVCG